VIVLVLPEPAPWAQPLVASLGGRVEVFSPRAVHLASRAIGALWARDYTDRRMRIRFARRALIDRMAARWLPRSARMVIAPSGAAERVFALARARGCETRLVHDLTCMRELHEDLDEAARRYPECGFLRRFRAPRALLTRQETERVLADRVMVRGAYAARLLQTRGVPGDRIERIPQPPERRPASPRVPTQGTLLLAGLAAARGGTNEALQALERRPHLTLLVRPGEGTEPRRLLSHPQVRIATRREREELDGVQAVLAPSWCESHAVEVPLAAALGVPVIGTARALGDVVAAHTIEPGDSYALGLAIDALG
jgi:hypothetical protein